MLTKEEHIKYWLNTAKKDWRAVQNMYKSKDYLPALFFAHLHTEDFMKKAIDKKIQGGKEKFGMNFTINHDLDKDSKIILFPKKLDAANKLLSRMRHT